VSSEDEFLKSALQFLDEIGVDTADVRAETNLIESGALDSLGTLAFLDFLEQQLGQEIDVEGLEMDEISTLRNAYRFVSGARASASP
jgi:acyl carrier protein